MEEEAESGKASHEVYKKTGGHTTEELTDIDLLINEAFKITDFTQLHISGFYGNSEKKTELEHRNLIFLKFGIFHKVL